MIQCSQKIIFFVTARKHLHFTIIKTMEKRTIMEHETYDLGIRLKGL